MRCFFGFLLLGFFVVCDCFCTVKAHLPPWWPIQVPLGLPSRAIMIKRTCISLPKDSKELLCSDTTCWSMMTGIVSPCACMYIRLGPTGYSTALPSDDDWLFLPTLFGIQWCKIVYIFRSGEEFGSNIFESYAAIMA